MAGKIAKYVTVGTNDLNKAKEFYDKLFEELAARSFAPNERSFFYTLKDDDTVLQFSYLTTASRQLLATVT